MRDDCLQVDELLLQLADYKNDAADMAAEKLLRKCSTNWEAYSYLKDRVHDVWLPDSASSSKCDRSSKRYKYSCTNGKSTAGRMNQFKNIMTRGGRRPRSASRAEEVTQAVSQER
jgi:hypothetical protein